VRSLTDLNISNTDLDGSRINEGLIDGLQGARLEKLDISHNRCDADAVKVLLQAGSALSSLRCLRINENKPGIGDEGFKAVVRAMSTHLQQLEELEVRGPGYGKDAKTSNSCPSCSFREAACAWHCLIPWAYVFTRKAWSADGYSILTNDGAEELMRQSSTVRLTLLDLSGQNDIDAALRTEVSSKINGRASFGKSAFDQHACNGGSFQCMSCLVTVFLPIMAFLLIFPPVMVSLGKSHSTIFVMYIPGLFILLASVGSFSSMCPWPCCWRRGPYEINPHFRSIFPSRFRMPQPAVADVVEHSSFSVV